MRNCEWQAELLACPCAVDPLHPCQDPVYNVRRSKHSMLNLKSGSLPVDSVLKKAKLELDPADKLLFKSPCPSAAFTPSSPVCHSNIVALEVRRL